MEGSASAWPELGMYGAKGEAGLHCRKLQSVLDYVMPEIVGRKCT